MILPLSEVKKCVSRDSCNRLALLTLLHSFAANGTLVIRVDAAVAAAQQIYVALLDKIRGYVILLKGHIAKVLRSNGVRAAVPALQMLMFMCCKHGQIKDSISLFTTRPLGLALIWLELLWLA